MKDSFDPVPPPTPDELFTAFLGAGRRGTELRVRANQSGFWDFASPATHVVMPDPAEALAGLGVVRALTAGALRHVGLPGPASFVVPPWPDWDEGEAWRTIFFESLAAPVLTPEEAFVQSVFDRLLLVRRDEHGSYSRLAFPDDVRGDVRPVTRAELRALAPDLSAGIADALIDAVRKGLARALEDAAVEILRDADCLRPVVDDSLGWLVFGSEVAGSGLR